MEPDILLAFRFMQIQINIDIEKTGIYDLLFTVLLESGLLTNNDFLAVDDVDALREFRAHRRGGGHGDFSSAEVVDV